MGPKKGKGIDKGKAKVDKLDKSSTDRPEDLPEDVKNPNMSWRNPGNNSKVLTESSSRNVCWSDSFPRMIGAHLVIHGKVEELVSFSAKHFYAHTKEKNVKTGYLKKYTGVQEHLKNDGFIEEVYCKCIRSGNTFDTSQCDKVKGRQIFNIAKLEIEDKVDEKKIISLLKNKGPIAAEIKVDSDYQITQNSKKIYFGPSNTRDLEDHMVLLTGFGTQDGINFFEFQNSWGTIWGDEGFGKLARLSSLPKGKKSLIVKYMYPELLEEVFHQGRR